jgi:hypothetical protein
MTTLQQTAFCVICHQPMEFDELRYVDENGKPVHEICYVDRVVKEKTASTCSTQSKFDCTA